MNLGRLARAGAAFFVFGALALLSGCGSGGRTANVSGSVTYDGKPLEKGTITFRSGVGKETQVQSGDIVAGKYACSAPVGKPTVEIAAYAAIVAGDTTGMGQKNYIPEKYNATSKLTADVGDGANVFNYDLKSK